MQRFGKPVKLDAVAEESGIEAQPEDLRLPVSATFSDYCLNCGALLTGPYCSCCGQKRRRPRIGFREFLQELVHEFLHLDGKFARTMGLLLRKPGQLTIEFLAGRRASYVSPLKLYLVWSAVFFTLAISFPTASVLKVGNGPPGRSSAKSVETADSQIAKGARKFERDPTLLAESFLHNSAKGMFLLMPFFALLLFVFFRKREPFYLPHLYFSIHYHSFAFLAMSVMVLLRVTKLVALAQLSEVVNLFIVIYLYLSLRRVYGASRLGTIGRMIGVGFIYLIGLVGMMGAVLAYLVLTA